MTWEQRGAKGAPILIDGEACRQWQSQVATVIGSSPDDLSVKTLVVEAVQAACREYCPQCGRHGGSGGQMCQPGRIHYGRVLATHITGGISDQHLTAVQVTLGSAAPIPEKFLQLEAWQA